jgi:hypothetical protein
VLVARDVVDDAGGAPTTDRCFQNAGNGKRGLMFAGCIEQAVFYLRRGQRLVTTPSSVFQAREG